MLITFKIFGNMRKYVMLSCCPIGVRGEIGLSGPRDPKILDDARKSCIWITDNVIQDLMDIKYKFQISDTVYIDGNITRFGGNDSNDKITSIKDNLIYDAYIGCTMYLTIKWKDFGTVTIDTQYIRNKFNDPYIEDLVFYNSNNHEIIINRMNIHNVRNLYDIIRIVSIIIFNETLLKGG